MNQALENAIYYINNGDNFANIITSYSYDGTKKGFGEAMKSIKSDIQVKNIFKNFDNVYYDICEGINRNYDNLLIASLDKLLIITREDSVICIEKIVPNTGSNSNTDNTYSNGDTGNSNNKSTGIIKIDAVLVELLIKNQKGRSWFDYPIIVIFSLVLAGSCLYNGENWVGSCK